MHTVEFLLPLVADELVHGESVTPRTEIEAGTAHIPWAEPEALPLPALAVMGLGGSMLAFSLLARLVS